MPVDRPGQRKLGVHTVDNVAIVTALFRRAHVRIGAGAPEYAAWRRVVLSLLALSTVALGIGGRAAAAASPGSSTSTVLQPGPTAGSPGPGGTAGSPGAGATAGSPESGGTVGSAIDATEAQVDAIEAEVASQQQTLDSLTEQYDQATVQLAQTQAQLAQTTAQLAEVRRQRDVARHQLQVDAVNAYIFDTPAGQTSSLFSTDVNSSVLRDEYQQTAIGDIGATLRGFEATERQMNATQSALQAQEQQSAAAATTLSNDEQAAQNAAAASESTLSQVTGQLARLVAQQAAEQAATEASDASAADSEAAKAQAAELAAQDAQLAQTFGAGSAQAVQATDAANQASLSAGVIGVVGTGMPQAPSGAGAVALRAAEQFLGIPYQWGGASRAGVDCSGLTMMAWRVAGVHLVHSAAIQYEESQHVPLGAVRPGDLLFYDFGGAGIDHVVMYVGAGPFGADTVIQAAHTGTVVELDPLWYEGLVGAARP
jgi:peptidoglycan DL-endopeptidase CwlO